MGCGCSIKGNGNVEKPEHPTANQAQPVADVMPRPGVMVSPWSDWSLRAGAELEPLLECTTLVCVRWLVKLGERGGVIPAWQNLPAEAKVSIDDLRSSVGRVEGGPYGLYYGLPVLVLSYPWWAQRHPDPEGAQLRMLLPIFRAIVANLDSMDESMRLTWGVVWDFCAFPQRGYSARPGRDSALTDGEDRSEEEVSRFRAGLSSVNVWYMHPYVWTLLVDTPITDASATYKQPYRERGWPTFERSVAALVKNMANLLSLERYIAAEMPNWLSIVEGCRAGRAAPLAPPAFSAMMRDAVGSGALRVTNGSDVEERLIPQYELGFKRAYSTPWIREMWYAGQSWTDEHIAQLAVALRFAHEEIEGGGGLRDIEELHLGLNELSDAGMRSLLEVFWLPGVLPKLQMLSLDDSRVGTESVQEFAELLESGDALQALNEVLLENTLASDEAVQRVRLALRRRRQALHFAKQSDITDLYCMVPRHRK